MDGRVKTLHPKLYAGLLAVRDNPEHLAQAAEHDIEFVDLVCVNLYPFERTAGRRGVGEAEVIENIDIGGPTMIRAAAKNYAFAAVVVNPETYDAVLDELRDADGTLSIATREALAAEAFAYTARYDTAIARWFAEKRRGLPAAVRARLREGRRPALRREPAPARGLLRAGRRARARAVAWSSSTTASSSPTTTCSTSTRRARVVARLRGPGVRRSSSTTTRAAWRLGATRARGLPPRLRVRPAERLRRRHRAQPAGRRRARRARCRAVHRGAVRARLRRRRARGADARSRTSASSRTRSAGCRCSASRTSARSRAACSCRTATPTATTASTWRSSPSASRPTQEWGDLLFAWRVCRHVKSNAIVLARDAATVGIGAGQMSRVDSVRLAVEKARRRLARGRRAGLRRVLPVRRRPRAGDRGRRAAIIQPGGSVRDERGHRRRRRGRRRDGVHRPPPLPPLRAASMIERTARAAVEEPTSATAASCAPGARVASRAARRPPRTASDRRTRATPTCRRGRR